MCGLMKKVDELCTRVCALEHCSSERCAMMRKMDEICTRVCALEHCGDKMCEGLKKTETQLREVEVLVVKRAESLEHAVEDRVNELHDMMDKDLDSIQARMDAMGGSEGDVGTVRKQMVESWGQASHSLEARFMVLEGGLRSELETKMKEKIADVIETLDMQRKRIDVVVDILSHMYSAGGG